MLCWSMSAQAQHDHSAASGTINAEILAPATFQSGNVAKTVLRLTTHGGKPVTPDQLKLAHTEKLHLLVIDKTLTDYHHEHPVPAEKAGEYAFEFSPRVGGTYSIWADVVPITTNVQEYVRTDVQVQGAPAQQDNTVNTTAEAAGYRFTLSTESNRPLEAGRGALLKIKVTTADGKEFKNLEPVMGAFAHMVGFPQNLESVMHVHPLGEEPQMPTDRGGPDLSFHVEPEQLGFHKFFLQTQIGGCEIYAGFGLNVERTATDAGASHAARYTCPMHPAVKQGSPGKCPECGMSLVADQPEAHQHQH
ncbi:hypothetical protein BH18VER1_BH18VER1_10440 [soil metagenome]